MFTIPTEYIEYIAGIIRAVVIPVMALNTVPLLVWVERRGSALIQNRVGPHRANIMGIALFGLLHPIADALKMLFKEPFRPSGAHPLYYHLAPAMVVIPALLALAVIPLADHIHIRGVDLPMSVAEMEYGLAYIFAVSSISVLGITLAGWASNNKYSLLGGLRSTAQMISYEISLGLSVMGILLIYQSLNLNEIVRAQGELLFGIIPKWGILLQPLGFILFLMAAFAESNRLPFDLPEGEAELVAGYHVEYGGMKFSMFMMGEFVAMIVLSGTMTTLFLGGWQIPWVSTAQLEAHFGMFGRTLLQVATFHLKTAFFLWLFIWVRWTLPRFRYDQLMRLGWKMVLPLTLINLFVTALVLLFIG